MGLGEAIADFGQAIGEAFSGLGEALGFGGGGFGSGSGSGQGNLGDTRPEARPSIMTRGDQMVATRDIPEYGIKTGQTFDTPDYGAFSLRGLTSTDPANIARNIQGQERSARSGIEGGRGDGKPAEVAKGERPAPVTTKPKVDVGEAKGARPTEEGTGDGAAARARRLGLASTIATSPGGLLAEEGTTRSRRSLMGGGLIK